MPLKFTLEDPVEAMAVVEELPCGPEAAQEVEELAQATLDSAVQTLSTQPDPTLLAQFRAAAENYQHLLSEERGVDDRVQKGVEYLLGHLADAQCRLWVTETKSWPAEGIVQARTLEMLEERVKVIEPDMVPVLDHWIELLREREKVRQQLEWEAAIQHDVEQLVQQQTGARTGYICARCYSLVIDGACPTCWPAMKEEME